MRTVAAPTLLIGLALIVVTAGCSRQSGRAPAGETLKGRPRSTASIQILEPAAGAEMRGSKVRVRIGLTGGEYVPNYSTDLTPNLGHIHLTIDGQLLSTLSGLDQEISVTPGPHLLQAEFVALDHFPFDPRVITSVSFVVK